MLFFSEDQFLDIFHEELEGRIRKTKLNTEVSVCYDNANVSAPFQNMTHSFLYNSKWRRLHMVISAWILVKPIFIINPTITATKFYGFFYKPPFFLVKPSLSHSEYWYVFMDMDKTNHVQYLEE